jgi:aspartyl-tRNA(Asn)/glutamyl-tRNA(Gln) amidotransferase subunit A
MYLADVFVCSASLAGIPAMSLPVGRAEGLPVGGQFIAPALGEAGMLSAAGALEAALDASAEVR